MLIQEFLLSHLKGKRLLLRNFYGEEYAEGILKHIMLHHDGVTDCYQITLENYGEDETHIFYFFSRFEVIDS